MALALTMVSDMSFHISVAFTPKALTAPIIAKKIMARIMPYSTAVAPRWSLPNLGRDLDRNLAFAIGTGTIPWLVASLGPAHLIGTDLRKC